MVTSMQRFGTLFMFIGSFLYLLFLFEMSSVPQIAFFQLVTSISTFVGGGIMSYGLKEIDDRFMKTLGINSFTIGIGYECKSAFIYNPTAISYISCVLGGFLMIGGIVLVYLKRGKPTQDTIKVQLYFSVLIFALASVIITLDIVFNTFTRSLRFHPQTADKAWIDLSIGMMFFLNWISLSYILVKKKEGGVEPDVLFFSHNSIFFQLFY